MSFRAAQSAGVRLSRLILSARDQSAGSGLAQTSGAGMNAPQTICLPYPPSVNRYWRSVKGRVLVSAEGRAYRSACAASLLAARRTRFLGRLSVSVLVQAPDARRRDLDNVLKALLDACTHGGLWSDDSQIDRLTVERGERVEGGRVWVTVSER